MNTLYNLAREKPLGVNSSQLIGLSLGLLAIVILSGWLVGNEAMVQIVPGSVAMGINAAIMFLLAGICLLRWPSLTPASILPLWCAAALILLPLLIAIQYTFDISLGIDLAHVHAQVRDDNPRPGRVSPSTALAFFFCGWAFLLMHRPIVKNARYLVGALVIAVLTIGSTGLLGYVLGLESMYHVATLNRMAAPAAVGMSLLGVGLWILFRQTYPRINQALENEDKRITRIAAAVMIVLAIAVGFTSFAVLKQGFEKSLAENTYLTAKNNALLISNTLDQSLTLAKSVVLRPALLERLSKLSENPEHVETLALVSAVGKSLLQFEFSGIRFFNAQGDLLVSSGQMVAEQGPISIPLVTSNEKAWLVWQDGFLLRIENKAVRDGRIVGRIVAEQRLTGMTALFNEVWHTGNTHDALLCGRETNNAACFPTRFYAANTLIPMFKSDGSPNLPISQALLGKSGAYSVVDLRGISVLAGYAPISTYGLGLVIKTDLREMYSPLRDRLHIIIGMLLLFVFVATYLLRKQLQPLVARIVSEERRMKGILENSHDAFVAIDHEGLVSDWNTQAEHTFGWNSHEALGKDLATLIIPPDVREAHNEGFQRFINTGTGPVINNRIEVIAQHRSGKQIPVELSIAPFHDGKGYLANAFLRDISERKRAEVALFSEKERLRVTLSSIGDAVITTDISGCVSYLNPVAEKMTGWSKEEAFGLPIPKVFYIINEKTGAIAPNPVEAVLKHEQVAALAADTVLLQRGGAEFPIEDSAAPIRDAQGATIGVVLVFHDVTHARGMVSKMTYQASHDALTGLINRREFERRLELALQIGKQEAKEHALLYLDLDQFKIVNDTCGHASGDELLRQLATILQGKLRQSDSLARLGGDEFGVLLENCPLAPAIRIAELLRQTVSDFHFVWVDKTFAVGVSIGVVAFSNGGISLTDIFQMADEACYAAKDKGRNRIQIYTPEDRELAQRRGEMGWMEQIQAALDEQRFVLYSQKILPLSKEHAADDDHYEILVRMVDKTGGLVPPMAFIPAAERYGLMPQIDRWVIKNVFAQYEKPHSASNSTGTCAINLSGASISDEHFFEYVRDMLQEYQIPPQGICFEITETSAIANLARAMNLIHKLKELGCRFSLDDFGSGMSSFAYLKHLPVDYLKIDGGFVKDMVDDATDRAMVEAINHIGHVMGIKTIAEFVENDAILAAVRAIGVDFAQGYGIEKPKPRG